MKKTMLFLMLALTISVTAQTSEEKNGAQWLKLSATNQQTLKQSQNGKQAPAANEFSQSLRKPSLLQQKLQGDGTTTQARAAASSKISKAKAAAISWHDIGTLTSWTETINFDPENTELIPIQMVNEEYGYTTNLLCYAVQFTLAQDELITAMSDPAYKNDFAIYSDPEVQQEVTWGYGLMQPLKAGTYYLLISDAGYFQWEWNTEPFQVSVELHTPATDISLPYRQGISVSPTNSVLLFNYYMVFYKFTLDDESVVNFGAAYDQEAMGENMSYLELDLLWDNNVIRVENSDILLKAGDYYLVAYGIMWDDEAFWESHASLEAQLDIQTKTLAAPVALSIPFEQDFSFTPDNAYNLAGNYSLLYSLHLDNIQLFEIGTGNRFGVAIYDKETWTSINGFRIGQRAVVQLPAGDYYLAIADYAALYDGTTPVSGHLSIGIPHSYATLDFSETIALGETKVGDDNSLTSVITDINDYTGIEQFDVAAYHFTAQEGHIYKLIMECYAKTSPMRPSLALFRAPNTGDIYADNIRGAMPYIDALSGTGSLTWMADADGDINVMFYFNSPTFDNNPASDVMFKLTLEEIQVTHTDTQGTTPAYENITLPFVSWLHFDPAYNAYPDASGEYLKLYRLTLTEKTLLTLESGSNPKRGSSAYFRIFTDEARTQEIGNWWEHGEGNSQLLNAGTYYLAMTENGYFNSMGEYAECLVELTGSADFVEIPAVTVAQLLDGPEIPVINYTGDLSYTDAGYFVYGTSQLVTDPAFYYTNLFAKGYKLTGMNVDDEVRIANRQPENEYESIIGIYQKEADGSYTRLVENYFWNGPCLFKATEARDYYIMTSASNSYPGIYSNVEYPSYQVAVWTGAAEDEPATADLQLPAEILIASTAADATNIFISPDASSVDVKLVLMALEVSATTQAGTTVVLENNPFSWEVNDLGQGIEASFVVIPIPYLKTETYIPATVHLNKEAGINVTNPETIRITHSGKGFVTITGLQGKEAISIIDMNGRIIRKIKAQGTTATIETNALPGGVYIVAVQNGKRLTVLKFIR